MKITVNREEPAPPPVKSITVEFSVDQLRYIKYLAARGSSILLDGAAADRLYHKLESIPELNVPVDFNVRF